jgi:hypothetical protein
MKTNICTDTHGRTRTFTEAVMVAVVGIMGMMGVLRAEDFGITNVITSGAVFTNAPTNLAGLNTGKSIDVNNYSQLGITVEGDYYTTNGTHSVFLDVKRANLNTGESASTNRVWETTPVTRLIVPVPSGTNHFIWHTNLGADIVNPASNIGFSLATNNLSSGEVISNFLVRPKKKLTGVRYP